MSALEHFREPVFLALLGLLPLLAWRLAVADRLRRARIERIVGPRVVRLVRGDGEGRARLRRRLMLILVGASLLAASQPLAGKSRAAREPRGVDLVVVLDVSRSMLARDLLPSRLDFARRQIKALATAARLDRLALLVFAGEARLLTPLTEDESAFSQLVDLADPTMVTRGGTDLGAAIQAGLQALEGDRSDPGCIVLVTDGEDHEGRGLAAAAVCRERGIVLHCAGVGSAAGGKIVVDGRDGESYLRDAEGREVVTTMDVPALRAIAEAGGGDWVELAARPDALASLHERRIEPQARLAAESETRRERPNRFQWPLLLAFLAGILEFALPERRRR